MNLIIYAMKFTVRQIDDINSAVGLCISRKLMRMGRVACPTVIIGKQWKIVADQLIVSAISIRLAHPMACASKSVNSSKFKKPSSARMT